MLIRVMTWIALTFGRQIARIILHPISFYFVVTSKQAKIASTTYLKAALKREVTWIDFYRHIHCFASVILDRLYFLNGQFKYFEFHLHNHQCVNQERIAGRGGFLVGAHLGSFEAISAVGHDKVNLKIALLMYQEHAKKISYMMREVNDRQRYEIIPLGNTDSMLKVNEHLSSGSFIGMLADRTFGSDTTISAAFLGKHILLPKGAFKMAALLRKPVYLMVGLYAGGARYDIHFEELYNFSTSEHRHRGLAVDAAITRYANRLEYYCQLAPYNWFNFFDIWANEPSSLGKTTQ